MYLHLHYKRNKQMRRKLATSTSKIGKARIEAIRFAESKNRNDLRSKIANCMTEEQITNLIKDLK